MKATLKKQLARLDLSVLLGVEVPLTDRNTGVNLTGTVLEVTGSAIVVESSNGRFAPTVRRFRRDVGTQLGGSFRLEFAKILQTTLL